MTYNKEHNKLGSIPCHTSCRHLWDDGKEYEKDKDYEVQHIPTTKPYHGGGFEKGSNVFYIPTAVPLPHPAQGEPIIIDGKKLGHAVRDIDGFHYFYADATGGWNEYALKQVQAKLEELNRPIRKSLDEYFNAQPAQQERQEAFTDEDKTHYEALLECCNKLLDSVDAGKVPRRQIMGLRILLNRPQQI